MIHSLRRIYLLFVLYFLFFVSDIPLFAQWEFLEPPGPTRNTVQALAEVKIAHSSLLLAATKEGIFLDPGGNTTQTQWIDISHGIPPGSRDICSIITSDSFVIVASRDGHIFQSALNTETFPVFEWKKLGTGLSAGKIFMLQQHESVLYAATNSGVWMLPLVNPNGPRQPFSGKKSPQWQQVGQNFTFETNTLLAQGKILYAALREGGLYWYNLDCSLCKWNKLPLPEEFSHSGVQSLAWLSNEQMLEMPGSSFSVPCSGLVVAPASSEQLLLGITIPGETKKMEWLNISPGNANEHYRSPVTTIITHATVYEKMMVVGTESRGILASPDCGQTWLALHGNSSSNLAQSFVQTLYGNGTHILAGIQQNPTQTTTNIASLTAVRGSLRDILADASQFVSDTSRKENRLSVTADVGTERGTIIVNLGESQYIDVMAYNLLGKKVLDIYSGDAKSGSNSVSFNMSSLSNGLYICVVRGKTFKLAEKFLVSR